MIAYGAILPHPPFVIESLAGRRSHILSKTRRAMQSIGEDLRALHVETVVWISTHGERYADALGIAFHDPYEADLQTFGDMRPPRPFAPDMQALDRLQRGLRQQGLRSTMTTNDRLDHAVAIPLLALAEYIHGMRMVVLAPPSASGKQILSYGSAIRELLDQVDRRIAVICTAELSNRHADISPGGMHPGAQAFDDRIRHALTDGNSMALLSLSSEEIETLGGQDIDALRLFWGVLDDQEVQVQERAYEHPLGIGYLTMAMLLS